MQVETLFERLKVEWPIKIDISDGYAVGDSGYMFPNLSGAWDAVEEKWKPKNDQWMNVGIWCFFQTAHKAAREEFNNGKKYLKLNNLSILDFKNYLRKNLEEPEWDNYRDLLE